MEEEFWIINFAGINLGSQAYVALSPILDQFGGHVLHFHVQIFQILLYWSLSRMSL